jgi:hypothetical protein
MKILNLASLVLILFSGTAFAGARFMETDQALKSPPSAEAIAQFQTEIDQAFPAENYREVTYQVIYKDQTPNHLLVYLFVKGQHRVDFASIAVDASMNPRAITENYKLTEMDHKAQSGAKKPSTSACPDTSVQFLSVCPNNNSLEINIVQGVASAAVAAGLKTKVLLQKDATSKNYLAWMSCPNLVGNFYDGDANTGVLATSDGEISAAQFVSNLKGAFRSKVTNIWLACEAYNNPMLAAVRDSDQSQKYAAGINDLQVGPSDNAAACAMKAAIAGKPMTAAFQACYKSVDNSADHWGFGGAGSDLFGH